MNLVKITKMNFHPEYVEQTRNSKLPILYTVREQIRIPMLFSLFGTCVVPYYINCITYQNIVISRNMSKFHARAAVRFAFESTLVIYESVPVKIPK